MHISLLRRPFRTRVHTLPDGRRVTIRRAVVADDPRLGPLGLDVDDAFIAMDDHGEVVGHATRGQASGGPAEVSVSIADGWPGSVLEPVLAAEVCDRAP